MSRNLFRTLATLCFAMLVFGVVACNDKKAESGGDKGEDKAAKVQKANEACGKDPAAIETPEACSKCCKEDHGASGYEWAGAVNAGDVPRCTCM